VEKIAPLIKRALPHVGAILLFLVVNSLFFYPQFEGLQTSQYDSVEGVGKNQEVWDHRRATGEEALWTNSIFVGMPSFYNGLRYDNYLTYVEDILQLFFNRPIGFFMVYMVVFYFSMLFMKLKPLEAMLSAVAFGMATNNIILYDSGHMSKVGTIMYSPFMIAGLYLLVRKKFLIGTLIYAVGLAMGLKWGHVQMTYYLYLCLAIMGIVYLVKFVKAKDYIDLGKIVLFALIGTGLGFASNLSKMWSTYEYGQETMRGEPILVEKAGELESSSTTAGLDWDYAMAWSNNTLDVLAGLIPGIVGGSSGERMSSGVTYDALRNAGQAPSPDGTFALPMYWGDLPFTSGPIYFGAILIFLFVMALFLTKGPMKWWLAIATLFTVFISYGKNMELFNWLLFEYVPMFNRFRTPNSVLSITTMLIPILAALGLHQWFRGDHSREDKMKYLMYASGITGGFCLLMGLVGPGLFSFEGARDGQLAQSGMLELIMEDRKAMLRSDAFRSFIFIALAAGALWLHHIGKIKPFMALAGIALFIIIDFWGVNRRYIHPTDFVSDRPTIIDNYYQKREVDRQIMARHDNRGEYRVLDLSINTFNTNLASYHHNTIGGYSAVKLQRIQDMIDIHISRMNMDVLNMLNTTYIIRDNEQLQVNDGALGWAWFVSDIERVESPRQEIEAMHDFDPAQTAIVLDSEFDNYTAGLEPTGQGTIERTVYELDRWVYEYETDSDQLAVFSEIWYNPDKGLSAYLDGEPVPFIRANYCLRAIKVPAGSGTIEFRFEPRSYIVGNAITQATSALLVIALIGWLGWAFYQNKDRLMAPIEPKPKAAAPGPKKKRRKKRR